MAAFLLLFFERLIEAAFNSAAEKREQTEKKRDRAKRAQKAASGS